MRKPLTEIEDQVLMFLFENRESGEELSAAKVAASTGLPEDVVREALASLAEAGLVCGPPSLLQLAMASLAEMDPNLTPISEGYAEHIILIASAISDSGLEGLAKELGYDAETVNLVGSRLRMSGIWSGNEVSPSHLEAWRSPGGGVAFFMDAAVATGDFQIVGRTPEPQYQVTSSGNQRVTKLLKRPA